MHVQESEEAVEHVLGQCNDVMWEHKKINRELVDVRGDIELLEKLVDRKRDDDYRMQQILRQQRMPLLVLFPQCIDTVTYVNSRFDC